MNRESRSNASRVIQLKNALKITHPDLEEAYESIVNILNANNIPDNTRMAAFGIRELLNKLPEYVNAPFNKNTNKLGMLTVNLKSKWQGRKIEACLDIAWSEYHIEQIKNFLIECRDFFQRNDEIHLSRKEKAIAASRTLNTKHSEENLPEHLEERIAIEWNGFLDYFNGVAHSKYGITPKDQFIDQLSSLEEFLIGLLEPNVFDDMQEIDEIINAGENNAQ